MVLQVLPIVAVLLFGALCLDGELSRADGGILLASYAAAVLYLRELPAALEGRAEIAFGNVVGSIFAFFLLNAGIIAMVRPIPVERQVLAFHLPVAVVTTILVSGIVMTRRVPRWAGVLLMVLYVGFIIGSYVIGRGPGRFPAS